MTPARYARVPLPRINQPDRECRYCGRYAPNARDERGPMCAVAVCLCCGLPQCFGNGGGHGQCAICFVGLLPGWSGNTGTCRYKGCGQPAVARGRGRKMVCADHARHQGIGTPHLAGWALVP